MAALSCYCTSRLTQFKNFQGHFKSCGIQEIWKSCPALHAFTWPEQKQNATHSCWYWPTWTQNCSDEPFTLPHIFLARYFSWYACLTSRLLCSLTNSPWSAVVLIELGGKSILSLYCWKEFLAYRYYLRQLPFPNVQNRFILSWRIPSFDSVLSSPIGSVGRGAFNVRFHQLWPPTPGS